MSWWKNSVFYEVYLPSFCDSDGDGIGDFQGLISKLPYLHDLGVDCLWITPFYPSPRVDNGYDVSDYYQVDKRYGRLEDFKECISTAQKYGIKIIIDVVVNHTSTQHPWFIESSSSKSNAKRDWYIWNDKPNNWESFFGGSAWEYSELTQQYYYHSFAKEQADLNWQNPEVIHEIKKMLKYWVSIGVAGFRFDVINNLTVDNNLEDNPCDDSGKQVHLYDVNQKNIKLVLSDLLQNLREEYPTIFTVGEISSDRLEVISQYSGENLFDVTFNFNFGSIEHLSVNHIGNELQKMKNISGYIPTLFFNSHDMSRSWNRIANEDFNIYRLSSLLILFNHGVTFLYQGEEQALGNFIATEIDNIMDIQAILKYQECISLGKSKNVALSQANEVNRDKSRGMIPWDDVTTGWIGPSKKTQYRDLGISWYQDIIKLRKKLLNTQPLLDFVNFTDDYIEYKMGNYHVFLNFSEYVQSIQIVNLKEIIIGKFEWQSESIIQIAKKGFIIWEECEK